MPRLVALEWTEAEARVAVAVTRGDRIALSQAFSVPLPPDESGAEASESSAAEKVARALAARRLGRSDTLVAVGRSDVELRQLSLPPAPDEDLPEMVRFQAGREFNALEDDWPLDFLPIDGDAERPRNVLAAAISPARVAETREICRKAGLKLSRLVLRPCAAASLLCRRREAGPEEVRLVVDLLADEVDLTLLLGQKVVFLRHARLRTDPLDTPAAGEALASEIRRTMAATHSQLGGRRVGAIVLCGAEPEHTILAQSLEDLLATPSEVFDPFARLDLEGDLRRGLPDRASQFAALLGMLCDEVDGTPHAIDFLNPRRRPQAPGRRNTYIVAAVAAGLLLLAPFAYGWIQGRSLARDIRRLEAQVTALDKDIKAAGRVEDTIGHLDRWKSSELCWLDQLYWLSKQYPEARQGMLTRLMQSAPQARRSTGGLAGGDGSPVGFMNFDTLLRDGEALGTLPTLLTDDSHTMDGQKIDEDDSRSDYTLEYNASVFISGGTP
ncbi:MAG: type IV pilus biogenesis protein PilM [Planctomycetota bacterium]|jgi:Tfp pilus assembly PilM family ATPase